MQMVASSASVKFTPELSALLKRRAKKENKSLTKTVMEIVTEAMEREDDEYLVMRAEQNKKESSSRLYTHSEAWGL